MRPALACVIVGARAVPVASPEAEVEFEFDESSLPIIVVRWQGRPSDASIVAGLARLDAMLARGQRFGLIVDSRGSGGFTPEQRSMLVAHMKQNTELNKKYLVQAFVSDEFVTRTMYWGVQLLLPSPFPSKVFGDIDAARAWLSDMLGIRRA